MLTCIVCSKDLDDGSFKERVDDESSAEGKHAKKTTRTLTSQIKYIVLKASGAYKNCKVCSGSSGDNHKMNYAESDMTSGSERFPCSYRQTGNSNSMPRFWGEEMEARLKGLSSGEGTPASVSGRADSVIFIEEEEAKEWVAQMEPGILITFVSLPKGGNELKRVRFSRDLFDKWKAQQWWSENYDNVMELYNVRRFNEQKVPLQTSVGSENETFSFQSSKAQSPDGRLETPALSKESMSCNFHHPIQSSQPLKTETPSVNNSARTSSSRETDRSGELSISNANDLETSEWTEQDDPGVYITIRALPGGIRELRRIRFCRERFGESQAKLWWEENGTRVHEQYL